AKFRVTGEISHTISRNNRRIFAAIFAANLAEFILVVCRRRRRHRLQPNHKWFVPLCLAVSTEGCADAAYVQQEEDQPAVRWMVEEVHVSFQPAQWWPEWRESRRRAGALVWAHSF